jgi:hypothetical protein
MTNIAIEHGLFIVDLPIKDGDFPVRYVNVYHFGYLRDVTSHGIPTRDRDAELSEKSCRPPVQHRHVHLGWVNFSQRTLW